MTMPATTSVPSLSAIARGLQIAGAAMTLLAIVAGSVAPYCGSSVAFQAGMIALVFDAGALLVHRGSGGVIPVALLKAVAVGSSILLVASCAAPPVGYQPAIASDFIETIFVISAIPSVLGAVLLRFSK